MSTKRIRHTARFKFQIALEAIKSDHRQANTSCTPVKLANGRSSCLNRVAIFSLPPLPSNNVSKMTESRACMSKLSAEYGTGLVEKKSYLQDGHSLNLTTLN